VPSKAVYGVLSAHQPGVEIPDADQTLTGGELPGSNFGRERGTSRDGLGDEIRQLPARAGRSSLETEQAGRAETGRRYQWILS